MSVAKNPAGRPGDPSDHERESAPRSRARRLDDEGGRAREGERPGAGEAPGPDPAAGAQAAPDSSRAAGTTPVEAAVDFRDRWLRAEADLQNFRRRAQRDLEESVRSAEDRLLLEVIAQLDDLERALDLARGAGAPDPWVQGVQLVATRMLDDLARHGVVPMQATGRPFDPELHEALLEIEAPGGTEPGEVVQVVRQGYLRNGRALRAARVVVARHAE